MNIGDVLFRHSRITGYSKVKVIKITPTGNIRVDDGSLLNKELKKKTSDSWNTDLYLIWTQELEEKYILQNLRNRLSKEIKNLDVYKIGYDSAHAILQALHNAKRIEEEN